MPRSVLHCLGGLWAWEPEVLFLQGSDCFPKEVFGQVIVGDRGGADTALPGILSGEQPQDCGGHE